MTKRTEAKFKINRRLGVNLWGRGKSPLARGKENPPGQHGARRKKPSDFGTQLMAKQKLKGYYGNISEKQFRKLYDEAVRRRGDTSENLIELLERRLDAVVYRMKFAVSPFQARQIINHGHIMVNGKRVNIPSFQVKDGDVIQVKTKSKDLAIIVEAAGSPERDTPEYVEVDHKDMKGKFVRAPKLADVPYPVQMEPNLVIEFYSRYSARNSKSRRPGRKAGAFFFGGSRMRGAGLLVMAGLDPAIHVYPPLTSKGSAKRRRVDARIKSGHDGNEGELSSAQIREVSFP